MTKLDQWKRKAVANSKAVNEGRHICHYCKQEFADGYAARDHVCPAFHPEFPDYPMSDLPTMPQGFVDSSWHNDTCPSYTNDALGIQIFIDYVDPDKRESALEMRFHVMANNDDGSQDFLCGFDDWQQVLQFVETALPKPVPTSETVNLAVHNLGTTESNVLTLAIMIDDLDTALSLIMGKLGIKTGDVAGVSFSEYDDASAWYRASDAHVRAHMLSRWLADELNYATPKG